MADPNLSLLHRRVSQQMGPRTALRWKVNGRYQDCSFHEYRRAADGVAAFLIDLGVEPGDRVGMLSENRWEWLTADHAILSAGAVNVPMHAPLSPQQVQYQLSHSGARGVFVSGAAQAAKIVAVQDQLPDLEWIIVFDSLTEDVPLPKYSWQQAMHRGWAKGEAGREEISRREASRKRDDLATIIYTSGTTGNPKGVMLTHKNLISNAEGLAEIAYIQQTETLLSWLPYSHIYARTTDHYLTTLCGLTVALAESPETLVQNLAEVEPHWMTCVPRFYEKVWNNVAALPDDTRAGVLKGMFGRRLVQLSSGGAPLPSHICAGFHNAGLKLLEGYGLTECAPVISFNHLKSWKVGTVGQPLPNVEVMIAEDGEILTRGPHVMAGYWENPEATTETITEDGWLKTGDIGVLDDDNFLTITDRKKDLIVTSSGKNVAPAEIEAILTSHSAIDQAVVSGDNRPFLIALIVPNFEFLQKEFAEQLSSQDPEEKFLIHDKIQSYYEEEVVTLMQAVSSVEQVKKFLLLARAFQTEADELTATLKIRRRHILHKYADDLAALYD